jgi:hypothetical protein
LSILLVTSSVLLPIPNRLPGCPARSLEISRLKSREYERPGKLPQIDLFKRSFKGWAMTVTRLPNGWLVTERLKLPDTRLRQRE